MNELSLFSGAGGGLLASKYFLGWRTIGYVEFNDYCQRVLTQRIKDGLLDEAPIFVDIRTFISEGYAESYKGMVDVITAGFPCQPFSVAGNQKAEQDERNMWPATCRAIDIIKPSFAFLENVPGLISCGYIGNILQDLAEIGYDAKWTCLSAAQVGAPHKRERLWIVADSKQNNSAVHNGTLAREKKKVSKRGKRFQPGVKIRNGGRWIPEPKLDRVADGVDCLMDRLKAIGNGQVPQVAATAWNILIDNVSEK